MGELEYKESFATNEGRAAKANRCEAVLENLETLCSKCNIGKSNLE
jgi:hypothetical protein